MWLSGAMFASFVVGTVVGKILKHARERMEEMQEFRR